jgi:hypothetical protein
VQGRKITRQKLIQAVCYGFCLIAMWENMAIVDGSEFVDGSVSGPFFSLADVGLLALGGSLVVLFWLPRVSAILAITASLLFLPLILYFNFPGLFQSVFEGNWSVPMRNFVWGTWGAFGLLTVFATLYVSVRCLATWREEVVLAASNE